MFAQRFDPEAFTRKRKLSDDDIADSHSDVTSDGSNDSDEETSESDADSSDSASDDSDESDEDEITDNGDNQHDMEIDSDEAIAINTEGQEQYETKHQGIFAKLQKSMQSQPDDSVMHDEPEDLKEIAPMPQPTLPRDERLRTTTANNLNWLTTPIYSTPDKTKPFSEFALSPVILNNLHHDGFNDAFSVQITVLDMLLADIHQNKLKPESNGDLLVNASTGSGKTLSYSIPIVQDLIDRVVPRVRAIILVPTKPLIHQVKATLATLCKGTNLYTMSLKTDISIKDEAHKIKANVPDIIVSTPGRLVEHLINGDIDLKYLKWLLIDEADRLLNQLFQNWCDILIKQLDTLRTSGGYWQWQHRVKKLVFSATLTTDAGKLSMLKFFKPRLVIINEEQELVNEMFSLPRTLNEFNLKYGTAKNSIKPLILSKFLIKTDKLNNILIFTKSNESCMRLTKLLELIFTKLTLSITVQYLNSTNNSTTIRSKILKRFELGDINILVVTDLIARGVDILTITDVVNYDIPKSSREYIHRSGRTARAGNHGNVYNLIFGKGELKWFTKIMKDVSRKKDIDVLEDNYIDDGDDDVYKEALQQLQTIVN